MTAQVQWTCQAMLASRGWVARTEYRTFAGRSIDVYAFRHDFPVGLVIEAKKDVGGPGSHTARKAVAQASQYVADLNVEGLIAAAVVVAENLASDEFIQDGVRVQSVRDFAIELDLNWDFSKYDTHCACCGNPFPDKAAALRGVGAEGEAVLAPLSGATRGGN